MLTRKHAEWLVVLFFSVLIAIVFYEIATSMTEQGIASGGPYDNAAAYPRAIAIFIGALVALQVVVNLFSNSNGSSLALSGEARFRAGGLLVVFAIYLGCLDWLGYHLTTTPMAIAVMWLCGGRNLGKLLLIALGMAFALALAFEKILNVVLPGGFFGLNIPW